MSTIYRHSPWNLLEGIVALVIATAAFSVGGDGSRLATGAFGMLGLALTGYHLLAWRNRRLEISDDGIRYWDWQGDQLLIITSDEVQGIKWPLDKSNGESTPHRLYTTKGSAEVVGLSDLADLESHINRELAKRKPIARS